MRKIIIFIFIFVMFIGNVVFAEDIEFPDYPWYLPPYPDPESEIYNNYFIVKSEDKIYMFYQLKGVDNDLDKLKIRIGEDENGYYIRIYKLRLPNGSISYYLYNEEENKWYSKSRSEALKLYEYEVLYSNYLLVDEATGEVFFPVPPPPTLEEITAESVGEIPEEMAGIMRKMFPAGFGILLVIGLVRSLKVLYRYF